MQSVRLTLTLFLFAVFCCHSLSAQGVAINESGALPDPSAILDVQSTTKGFLAPRMTLAERNAIASPATGLLVYQTDGVGGYYYYNGGSWVALNGGGGAHWAANPSGIHQTTPGMVGMGTSEPQANLHLKVADAATAMVEGANETFASLVLRMRNDGPGYWGQFNFIATEYAGQKPTLSLQHRAMNWDYILLDDIVQFYGDSTLSARFFGDVRSDGTYWGQQGRFNYTDENSTTEVVHIMTEEMAIYGLHVDMNNKDFGSTGIASHVVGPNAKAIEGWSENGPGGYFSSLDGPALVTAEGSVGVNTPNPEGKVHVVDDESAQAELLLESDNTASIALRINGEGEGVNYGQYWINGHGDGISIARQDYAQAPDSSWAISSYLPMVDIGGSHAVRAYGNVQAHGSVELDGEVNNDATGAANMIPIAYGTVRSTGSVYTGTGNFSCTWNGTYQRYEISIANESYFWLNYITQITPMGAARLSSTSSVGGKLLVYLYDTNGNKVAGNFQFVTYQP